MIEQPVLVQPIPPQIINEGAAYGPFDLKEYIQSPNSESGVVYFIAELLNGDALPQGLICLSDGVMSGIPAAGTQGVYEVVVVAQNDATEPLVTSFTFTIKERIALETESVFSEIKSKVWEALQQNLPVPEFEEILDRPLTAVEIYYLLQRFATLTIWDIYNLDTPGEKIILELPDVSEHYVVYDRGSCLIGAPKDLFSHQRTLADALQTARAMAREVYRRGWTIEFAGFNKMVRASWVELQLLATEYGKELEVLHYSPTLGDIKVFEAEVNAFATRSKRNKLEQ